MTVYPTFVLGQVTLMPLHSSDLERHAILISVGVLHSMTWVLQKEHFAKAKTDSTLLRQLCPEHPAMLRNRHFAYGRRGGLDVHRDLQNDAALKAADRAKYRLAWRLAPSFMTASQEYGAFWPVYSRISSVRHHLCA